MTIYHFANETLGPEFFQVFQKIKEQYPEIRIVLVFSSLSYSKFEITFPAYLKRSLKSRYQNEIMATYDKVIVSKNINKNKFSSLVRSLDIGFITGFNQIFSQNLISRFSKIINFHPSLLPFYRGPIPSYWVLKNKEKFTGFSIHFITEKIDKGEVLVQKEIPILEGKSPTGLDKELSTLGAPFLFDLALDIINNKPLSKDTLNAEDFYLNPVDYKSFPKNS